MYQPSLKETVTIWADDYDRQKKTFVVDNFGLPVIPRVFLARTRSNAVFDSRYASQRGRFD